MVCCSCCSPWVRKGNVSNVWGATPSGSPATPVLGVSKTELDCREKCETDLNCTQYVLCGM